MFIVEGEKDADNLAGVGLVATCNAEGAAKAGQRPKWRAEYTDTLAGRRVCIVADKDEAGRAHAAAVVEALKGKAADVRVVELPGDNVKDATDWLDDHDATEPETLAAQLVAMAERARSSQPPTPHVMTAAELVASFPELNPPVLDGLLREGELLNLISVSKVGKSWLTLNLALSVVTGRPWLGRFAVQSGPVLLIDNELHASTIASRIRRVADAMAVDLASYGPALHVEVLRGHLQDLHTMRQYFEAIDPGRYRLIVLDAFYRFLPPGTNENDNGAMCGLYNVLDAHAQRLRTPFILIHHASKGLQSEKAVTDVGSGAGAMSRATDTHLILRPHEQPDAVAVEAAVRSWKPLEPFCLRWEWPLWTVAEDLDPADLRKARARKPKPAEEAEGKPTKPTLTPAEFVTRYVKSDPQEKALILAKARQDGLTMRDAEGLLLLAVDLGKAFRWTLPKPGAPAVYATRQPDLKDGVPS